MATAIVYLSNPWLLSNYFSPSPCVFFPDGHRCPSRHRRRHLYANSSTRASLATASCLILILSGDVETNPGPEMISNNKVLDSSIEVCPLCWECIHDANETREGQEDSWCAGIHKEDFKKLSSSTHPFKCPSYRLVEHQQLLESLGSTFESLD